MRPKYYLKRTSYFAIGCAVYSMLAPYSIQAATSMSVLVDVYEKAACEDGSTGSLQRWAHFLGNDPRVMGVHALYVPPKSSTEASSQPSTNVDSNGQVSALMAKVDRYIAAAKNPSPDDEELHRGYSQLGDILMGKVTNIDKKGLVLTIAAYNAPDTGQTERNNRIRAFFAMIETGEVPTWLTATCTLISPPPPPPPPSVPARFRIAANEKGLLPENVKDRDFATLSIDRDDQESQTIATITAAISYDLFADKQDSRADGYVFSELHYKQNGKEDPEINQLTFGAAIAWYGRPQTNGSHFWTPSYSLTGGWQTDTDFKASIPIAELRATWGGSLALGRNICQSDSLLCVPSFTLVADHGSVSDPGDNIALALIGTYSRLGFDAGVRFQMVAPDESSWQLDLRNESRYSLTSSNSDASLNTISLSFLPSEASKFKISLEYKEGETLRGFAPIDSLSFNIGVRY
jgi:hypothetical protein